MAGHKHGRQAKTHVRQTAFKRARRQTHHSLPPILSPEEPAYVD